MNEPSLFSPLQSLQLEIQVENLTSRTQIAKATLLEMGDMTWLLAVPHPSCALRHQLELKVRVLEGKKTLDFSLTALVQKVEPGPEEDRISIALVQVDPSSLHTFYDLYLQRQIHLMNTLLLLRGEDE